MEKRWQNIWWCSIFEYVNRSIEIYQFSIIFPWFNELIFENTPVKKRGASCVFAEGTHLLHGQVSLVENTTFHQKVVHKLYRNSKHKFLVNFNFVYHDKKYPFG